jgi:outer membrane protein TolC
VQVRNDLLASHVALYAALGGGAGAALAQHPQP